MTIRPEFKELLSESGKPCISIIIPTHRLSPERIQDAKVLKDAVARTKDFLKQQDPKDHDSLAHRIDELVNTIDYTHLKEGIGIFVSPTISKLIHFSFPVIEKIKVSDTFDTRDLLYDLHTRIDYNIFSISKKHIRFYEAQGENITELKNEDFPIDYEETYEYSTPSRGSSYGNSLKEFEKDKSVVQEMRLVDFLRTADHLLKKYLNNDSQLVVVGDNKEIADFLKVTSHEKQIIVKITGNYNFNGEMQLAKLAWSEVQKYQKKQNKNLISELREAVGKNMLAIGIEEVWKAVKEGKGLKLVVEKDLEHTGYINESENKVMLDKPVDRSKYLFVSDLVERILKITSAKNGQIIFVENGELEYYGGIALLLRYNGSPKS